MSNKMRKLIHRARRYYIAPSAIQHLNESEVKTALDIVTLDDIINESIREYKIKLHREQKNKEVNYAILESLSNGNKSFDGTEILSNIHESLIKCEKYKKAINGLKSRNKLDILEYISLLESEKLGKEAKGDFSDSDGIEPEDEEEEKISSEDTKSKDDDSDKNKFDDIDLEEPDDELDAEEGDTVNLEKISITVTDIDRIKKELKDYGIPEDAIEEADVEENEDQEDEEIRKGKVKIDSEYALELRDFFREKYDIDLEEKLGIEIEEADGGDEATEDEDKKDDEYTDDDIFKVDQEDDFDDFFGDDDEEENDDE